MEEEIHLSGGEPNTQGLKDAAHYKPNKHTVLQANHNTLNLLLQP